MRETWRDVILRIRCRLTACALGLGVAAAALGASAVGYIGIATADEPDEPVPEWLVKASLVYNIAKLTDWPEDAFPTPDAPFSVCLLNEANRYGNHFAAIAGKPVHGRTLEVRHGTKLTELKACQLLFLIEEDEPRLPAVASALKGLPVLTVSEIEYFVESGGMVALFLEDDHFQFKINPGAAAQARLLIHSQLLRMARIAKGRP